MKNLFAASALILSVIALAPSAQAAEKCDRVVLISLSHNMMPTRGNWSHEWRARFRRLVDNVELSREIEPDQLSESIVRGVLDDFGPQFWVCPDNGKIRIMPVPK